MSRWPTLASGLGTDGGWDTHQNSTDVIDHATIFRASARDDAVTHKVVKIYMLLDFLNIFWSFQNLTSE